jgi:hypothetical protein
LPSLRHLLLLFQPKTPLSKLWRSV